MSNRCDRWLIEPLEVRRLLHFGDDNGDHDPGLAGLDAMLAGPADAAQLDGQLGDLVVCAPPEVVELDPPLIGPHSAALVPLADLPALHSRPGSAAALFLDFDGNVEATWGSNTNVITPPFDIDGDATTFNDTEISRITSIWKRVSEDYAPFNLDVTTEQPASFANRVSGRIAIGGSWEDWFGASAGGVAFIGGFSNGSSNTGYVFADSLGDSEKNIGEGAAHESGHLFGLQHHSIYDENDVKVNEYNDGEGNWAPIMGVGYSRSQTTWDNGPSSSGANSLQDDLAIIASSSNNFGFRTDDHGNTAATPLTVAGGTNVSGSGLIERNGDVDVFSFYTTAGAIDLNLAINDTGPDLDARLELHGPDGTLLALANPTDVRTASITTTVAGGHYTLHVRSVGIYGYIGTYSITGTIVNGPLSASGDTYELAQDGSVSTTAAGSAVTLVSTGSTWKYHDDGSNQGILWRLPAFNDSAWASGSAELGFGDGDEAKVINGGPSGNRFVTTYFRRTFNASDTAYLHNVVLRLKRDDGAAVYLNGVEIARSNLADGAAYNTLADAAAEEPTVFQTFTVRDGLLNEGANLLAVEVHQNSASSSDLSFEMDLTATRTRLGVLANDSSPGQLPLTATVVQPPANAAAFTFNANGSFSYTPQANFSGTDTFTYQATNGTANTNVATASLVVRPTNRPPTPAPDAYTVNEDATLDVNDGPIALVSAGATWKYLDNGTNQGTAWRGAAFNDGSWAAGPAQLGYGDGDEATAVNFGPNQNSKYITTYLRRTFTVGGFAGDVASLDMTLLRDDGARVYLNGVEVVRTNLPGALGDETVNSGTLAQQAVGNADESTFFPFAINPARLVNGTNVLAVELHQSAADSSDLSFDLTLTARRNPHGLLVNDTDPDGQPLTAQVASQPLHGTVVVQPDGSFQYTPQANYAGPDSFSYRALDSAGTSLVPTGSVWRYLDDGSDLTTTWRTLSFNDSAWSAARAELGYGDDDEAGPINFGRDVDNKFATTYFRYAFAVSNPAQLASLTLRLKRDDGAAVYLNGTEIARSHLEAGAAFDAFATTTDADDGASFHTFASISASLLVSGINVLAVEVHQANGTSGDLSFDLELSGASLPAPTTVNVTVSPVNDLPTAVAGGPYVGDEGLPIPLSAAGSNDLETPPAGLTYEWDLNYGGASFDVDLVGAAPSAVLPDNFAARTIALRVTDSGLASSLATTTLAVHNVAPTVDAGVDVSANDDGLFTGFGSFADTGADTWTARVDYGDGLGFVPLALHASKTYSLGKQYLLPGDYTVEVEVTDDDLESGSDTLLVHVESVGAAVVGRQIFYNNSSWDGNDAAANPQDDAAIATDKTALLPGGTATLANYTSFNKGINGIMVDIAGLPGAPTAADFAFTTGNANATNTWTALATAPSVSIRPGAGEGGSTRVTLIWSDNTIAKRWLQVTVLAGGNTGLPADDVFYFGNAVGEAGNSAIDAQVNVADELGARGNPRNVANPAPITFLYDYNRDKQVNAADQLIARGNPTNVASRLLLIAPIPDADAPGAAGLAEAALGDGQLADAIDAAARRARRR